MMTNAINNRVIAAFRKAIDNILGAGSYAKLYDALRAKVGPLMPTPHDLYHYIAILGGGFLFVGLCLFWLTRHEDANRVKDNLAYEESRRYPD